MSRFGGPGGAAGRGDSAPCTCRCLPRPRLQPLWPRPQDGSAPGAWPPAPPPASRPRDLSVRGDGGTWPPAAARPRSDGACGAARPPSPPPPRRGWPRAGPRTVSAGAGPGGARAFRPPVVVSGAVGEGEAAGGAVVSPVWGRGRLVPPPPRARGPCGGGGVAPGASGAGAGSPPVSTSGSSPPPVVRCGPWAPRFRRGRWCP